MLFQQVAQVDIHLLRVLVHEGDAAALGFLPVGGFGALHDERDIFVLLADGLQQFETCLGVFFGCQSATFFQVGTILWETAVGNHAQRVVGVLRIVAPCLLIVSGQHHLGSSAHTERGRMGIQGFGGKPLALGQDIAVEIGQHRRIETDAVFHQQNHLHTGLLDVVLQVHLVLDELDDGENQVGVAQPAEYIVEYRHVFVLHSPRDTMREGGEHHAGHLGEVLLHVARHVEGIVVGITGHTDHKVELCAPEGRCGFVDSRHLGERGRIAQSQFGVFIENLLVHAPVVFQHKGIVGVGDD